MSIREKWIFVLIGNDKTGKTTFQKLLLEILTSDNRNNRLDCNLLFDISSDHMIKKMRNISFGNRSYQEKISDYKSVKEYFESHFCDADICVISSHLVPSDISEIIFQIHNKYANACAIFFSNSIKNNPELNAEISRASWDDRIIIENPSSEDPNVQHKQLFNAAQSFSEMLINRAKLW